MTFDEVIFSKNLRPACGWPSNNICIRRMIPSHRREMISSGFVAVAVLVIELFQKFPNYSVYDEDRNEDITNLVCADVNELFQSE